MNNGGDAAEQVVRISLEGIEVAAKITGEGAKGIAIMLAAVLKEEHKTKGKARLTNMIKSGKELKVFSIQNKDLKKFSQEAKRYGVLYCVLKDKENTAANVTVDVIARAEDASKIQRIVERFELATVDKASVVGDVENDIKARAATEKEHPEKSKEKKLHDEIEEAPKQKEKTSVNTALAKTEKGPLSEPNSKKQSRSAEGTQNYEKPSVREKMKEYAVASKGEKEAERTMPKEKAQSRTEPYRTTKHKQPKKKRKAKER